MADAQAVDERFGVFAALADAGLLLVEQLAADAFFVVHVQELALLLFDFLQDGPAALDLLLGGGDLLAEVFDDRLADLLAFGLTEWDTFVVRVDLGFDDVDWLVALRALAALVLGADEVFVVAAIAFVAGVDELAAAGAAADHALEVVLVLAVTLPGVSVRDEHGLDLIEQLLADQRIVAARVDVTLVLDVTGVVGVGQEPMDMGERERAWAEPSRRAQHQATPLQQYHDV